MGRSKRLAVSVPYCGAPLWARVISGYCCCPPVAPPWGEVPDSSPAENVDAAFDVRVVPQQPPSQPVPLYFPRKPTPNFPY